MRVVSRPDSAVGVILLDDMHDRCQDCHMFHFAKYAVDGDRLCLTHARMKLWRMIVREDET